MKKTIVYCTVAFLSAVLCYCIHFSNERGNSLSVLLPTEIEALTNCEAVDGEANDGHCVHDDSHHYFCKSPGFLEKKNCKQGHY